MNTSTTTQVIDPANTSYVLSSTALVWIMIPGIGFFYSGLARRESALSLIVLSFLSVAVVSFQWFLFGYSLTYARDSGPLSPFIGNPFDHIFLRNVSYELPGGFNDDTQHGDYPVSEMTFMTFQCMFAAVTPTLAIGSAAERGRILPILFFVFIWTTLVYDPIAHWNWSPNGVAYYYGLDFAGGTPVHVSAGFAALAYCILLRQPGEGQNTKPHNINSVILGTALLWFGWFGFTSGSALGASSRTTNAFFITNLSASIAGITWMAIDYYRTDRRKLSAVGFCCGVIAGLVVITPASGFVSPSSSVFFGFCAGLFCNLASQLKRIYNLNDACDIFAVHGVGGFIGTLLTGIFAQKYIAHLDNVTVISGGVLDGNWMQLGYQAAISVVGAFYSFVVSFLIFFTMSKISFLTIRATPEAEDDGLDSVEFGESLYQDTELLIPARN